MGRVKDHLWNERSDPQSLDPYPDTETGTDMHISEMTKSKYLKKEDCDPAILVTIKNLTEQDVSMENQPEDMKWMLYFTEQEKPLVLNITNNQLIAIATGSENPEGWIGKKIVLFNDPTIMFQGKVTGGIRVRAPKNQAPPAPVERTPGSDDDFDDDLPF